MPPALRVRSLCLIWLHKPAVPFFHVGRRVRQSLGVGSQRGRKGGRIWDDLRMRCAPFLAHVHMRLFVHA